MSPWSRLGPPEKKSLDQNDTAFTGYGKPISSLHGHHEQWRQASRSRLGSSLIETKVAKIFCECCKRFRMNQWGSTKGDSYTEILSSSGEKKNHDQHLEIHFAKKNVYKFSFFLFQFGLIYSFTLTWQSLITIWKMWSLAKFCHNIKSNLKYLHTNKISK